MVAISGPVAAGGEDLPDLFHTVLVLSPQAQTWMSASLPLDLLLSGTVQTKLAGMHIFIAIYW
jgi:hypothetical protein